MDKGPSCTSESWFCFQCKLRTLFSRSLTQKEKPEDIIHSHQTLCCPQRAVRHRRWRTPGPHGRRPLPSELAGWFCCCNPLSVTCLDFLSTEKVLKTWRDFVHLLSKDRMPSFLSHCMVLSIKHYRRRL